MNSALSERAAPSDERHTPGPWSRRRLSATIVITAEGKDVCRVPLYRFTSNDANEANARLIEAAPELLAAAMRALLVVETDAPKPFSHAYTAAASLRSAIAAATKP